MRCFEIHKEAHVQLLGSVEGYCGIILLHALERTEWAWTLWRLTFVLLLTQNCPSVLMCWVFSRASSSLFIRLFPWTTAALFTRIVTSPTFERSRNIPLYWCPQRYLCYFVYIFLILCTFIIQDVSFPYPVWWQIGVFEANSALKHFLRSVVLLIFLSTAQSIYYSLHKSFYSSNCRLLCSLNLPSGVVLL